jgi:Thymidine kinase
MIDFMSILCLVLLLLWFYRPRLVERTTTVSFVPRTQTPVSSGSITLIMGPMFSGKTRELKRRIDVQRIPSRSRQWTCLLIKYRKDQRYDTESVLCT